MLSLVILFALLLSAWLMLSGVFSLLYISLGVISCLCAVVLYKILYKEKIKSLALAAIPMACYSAWLIKQIIKSSIDVSLKMWQLEPDISPRAEWIQTKIKDDVLITIFANSITLTPGTAAIDLKDGAVYVHSLTAGAMEELKKGLMLQKVTKLVR